MAETLSPVPKLSFLDNNGNPLVGGKLFTYAAGTSTKLATYTNSGGGTPNSNPVVLDFRGEANIWIPANVPFKYMLAPANDTDPPGRPIWTVDNLVNSQLLTLYGGVDTGSVNAYILNFSANFTAYADGITIYWVPSNSNTASSTLNVNGLGPIGIVNANGSVLIAGDIRANTIIGLVYRSGAFYLLAPVYASDSFIGTLTGVTTTVTGTVIWYRTGHLVTMIIPSMTGTSDSTSCSITGVPVELHPATSGNTTGALPFLDNSIYVDTVVAGIGVAGTIVFGKGQLNGGFTGGGTKGSNTRILYTYSLE